MAYTSADVPPAGAHSESPGEGCHWASFDGFTFSGSEWALAGPDESLGDHARAGFLSWNEIIGSDGLVLHPVEEDGVPASIDVEFIATNDPDDDWFARVDCGSSPAIMEFNLDYLSEYQSEHGFMERIAAHEMGHAMSLEHTGQYDSADVLSPYSGRPVMATCLDPAVHTYAGGLKQDDEGALNLADEVPAMAFHWVHGSRPISRNPGFEYSAGRGWFKSSGAVWKFLTSNQLDGERSLGFTTSSGTQELYQTAYLATSSSFDQGIQAVANIAPAGPNDHGGVSVSLQHRSVTYDDGDNCATSNFASEVNQNLDRDEGSWVVYDTNTMTLLTSGFMVVNTEPRAHSGIRDYRISIKSEALNGVEPGWVVIDNAFVGTVVWDG